MVKLTVSPNDPEPQDAALALFATLHEVVVFGPVVLRSGHPVR